MATITIDDKEYDVDELSEEARAQVASINFVDQELAKLNARVAAMQTARNTYGRALNEILGVNSEAEVVTGDDASD
tara:strand:+ start:2772 stop:2999 length:228 start_codon:yes stop_codon:yes gene_type:complete